MLQAARSALEVAEKVLADPAHASLFEGGGWAGNRRRDGYVDDIADEDLPVAPPGAEQLVADTPDVGMLGTLLLSPRRVETDRPLPTDELEEDPQSLGCDALLNLLDWALTAATRPQGPWEWRHEAADATWRAHAPTTSPSGVVQLEVRSDNTYYVRVASPELREGELVCLWETQSAPSPAAAVLLAEHAAIEAGVGMRFTREERKRRLLLPRPASSTAEPTITDLILAAHQRHVFDFTDLAGGLAYLRYRIHDTTSAGEGHWLRQQVPDDPLDYVHSLTGYINAWCGVPGTHPDEPGNTACVDTPAYRRHLAAHGTALDPFVTCYLAAAERASGERDFEERHRAGAQALRTADLAELSALDPRPVPESLLEFVASIPLDIDAITDWYDVHCQD